MDTNTIDEKIFLSIQTNLFSETLNSRFLKLKYCRELGKILNINSFENLTKDISKYFSTIVDNKWLADNLISIIKTFRLSEIKYNTNEYYKLYQMYISMLTILFDKDLLLDFRVKVDNKNYRYYAIYLPFFQKHINIINKVKIRNLFNIHFID